MKIDVRYIGNVPYYIVANGTVITSSEGVSVTLAPPPDGRPAITSATPMGSALFICQSSFDELQTDYLKGAN